MGLYFVFLALIVYLLPILLNKEIIGVFSSKQILSLLILMLVIMITTITIQVFLIGKENGLDLLMISKPITKFHLVLGKWLTCFCWFVIVSVLATILVSFSYYSSYNKTNITSSLCIGAFLATFISSLIWSSITIVFSSFLSKFTSFLSVVGIQTILLVLCVILYFIPTPTSGYFTKNDLKTQPIGLISKSGDEFNYKYYAYATRNNKPITQKDLNNYSGVDANNFLNKAWNYATNKTNSKAVNIINLQNQFICMYRYYDDKSLESMNVAYKLLEVGGKDTDLSDWDLVFSTDNENILNQQNLLSFNDYVLGLNDGVKIYNVSRELSRINDISPTDYGSLNSSLFSKTINLPTFDLENNNWNLKSFSNLAEFASYYFNEEQITKVNNWVDNVYKNNEKLSPWLINANSYYYSLISTYLYQKMDITSLQDINGISNLIKDYEKMSFQFQYWTYLTLEQIFNNKVSVSESVLKTLFTLLNINLDNLQDINNKFALVLDKPMYFNSPSMNLEVVSNPLSLFAKNNLQTISEVKTTIEYDYVSLYVVWTSLAILLTVIGLSIMVKKDIY